MGFVSWAKIDLALVSNAFSRAQTRPLVLDPPHAEGILDLCRLWFIPSPPLPFPNLLEHNLELLVQLRLQLSAGLGDDDTHKCGWWYRPRHEDARTRAQADACSPQFQTHPGTRTYKYVCTQP